MSDEAARRAVLDRLGTRLSAVDEARRLAEKRGDVSRLARLDVLARILDHEIKLEAEDPEPAAGRPRQLGPEIEARLRAARKSASPPSFTQLARELGINRATCYKLLARTDGKINASR